MIMLDGTVPSDGVIMKVTEELRESWRREFSEINNPNRKVYRVEYIIRWTSGGLSRKSIEALHAHHAVSIVLDRDIGNSEFNSVWSGKARWSLSDGWSEFNDESD